MQYLCYIEMKLNKFNILITWSDEDQSYLVKIPELPG